MIFRAQPSDPWEPFDFALLEAYQTLKDETCSQCGHPVWLCRSTDRAIIFKSKQTTCQATRALENTKDSKKPQKDRAKADEKKEWGRFWYTEVDINPVEKAAGVKLPGRDEYYKSLIPAEKPALLE